MMEYPLHLTGTRRISTGGKKLHCCVVCNKLAPWGKSWFWYGSYREEDDGVALQKFCSEKCKKNQRAVTIEMREKARGMEYLPKAIEAENE